MSEIAALVQRWQSGDERAAEAIYNQQRGPTFGLAYALLGDPGDAEEVAQEALVYALTHIDRFDPRRSRFTTWLHTITVSRCRNHLRRYKWRSIPMLTWLSDEPGVADSTPGPEPRAARSALNDEVRSAIQRLSSPLREAIVLRYWSDYTYLEMADILHCSLGAAQSRVRLAHERLRALLDPDVLARLEEVTE
jgi:RNA polymerase sigma-70 factor (ECF subfamily)